MKEDPKCKLLCKKQGKDCSVIARWQMFDSWSLLILSIGNEIQSMKSRHLTSVTNTYINIDFTTKCVLYKGKSSKVQIFLAKIEKKVTLNQTLYSSNQPFLFMSNSLLKLSSIERILQACSLDWVQKVQLSYMKIPFGSTKSLLLKTWHMNTTKKFDKSN